MFKYTDDNDGMIHYKILWIFWVGVLNNERGAAIGASIIFLPWQIMMMQPSNGFPRIDISRAW